MKSYCNLRHPLRRDGTNQYQRLLDALRPASAPIDGRSLRERLRFAVDYAQRVQYYDLQHQPDGDWKQFFDAAAYLRPELTDAAWWQWYQGIDGGLEPHMALFFAFLEMLQMVVDHQNTLTQRHLDFYYRSILALPLRGPKPDELHALLELAQNTQRLNVPAGTVIDAGKDDNGRPLSYLSSVDTVVSKARVQSVHALYMEHDASKGERPYVAMVADSRDGNGGGWEGSEPKWRLMGQPQGRVQPGARTMSEAQLGWLLSAPVLALSEGSRSLHVQFLLEQLPWPLGGNSSHFIHSGSYFFELELSTDAGWHAVPFQMRFEQQAPQWVLHLEQIHLPSSAPAITKGNAKTLGLALSAPALRLRLKPHGDHLPYRDLSRAVVRHIHIDVEVNGMQKLDLRGESAQYTAGSPFPPFGSDPQVGDRLYVGCAEALGKELKDLRLNLEWADLPSDLGAHYAAYAPVSNGDFQCSSALLRGGEWHALRNGTPLFQSAETVLSLLSIGHPVTLPMPEGMPTLDASRPVALHHDGFLRLLLSGPQVPGLQAFGHRDHALLMMNTIMGNAQPNAVQRPLPMPPYTPKLRSIKLDYSASAEVEVGSRNTASQGGFWHVEPFGLRSIELGGGGFSLLPQYPDEGYSYIGLADAEPGSTVSLLLQVAEGSGNNWLDMDAATLGWSYLDGKEWQPLDPSHIVRDATDGLLQSGLITVTLPLAMAPAPARMGDGNLWLRLSLNQSVAGLPSVVGLHAQAVRAVLGGDVEGATHLGQPLMGGKSLRLIPQPHGLKSARMPYSSFGGRPAEGDEAYYTRVSERLRHKQRAITLWDYERLVLEAFPEIYKVKCIPHSSRTDEFVPGGVAVIVVPQLRNVNAVDPLRPAVGQGKLRKVQQFLDRHNASLFVEVQVENPSYEAILLEFKVGFHPGYDAGYHGSLLNESLKRFLAPWAYEEGQDIVFGGTIHKSAIIKFIEDQYYVDFVVDFVAYQDTNSSAFAGISWMEIECNFIVSAPDVLTMQASSERSVLISANTHRITVLEPGVYPCTGQAQCSTP